MEKTKLGISVGLMGALMFLSGYLGITALVLVGGYILLKEDSHTLKKYAVYTLVLYLAFLAATMVIGLANGVLNVVNFKNWIYSAPHLIGTLYSVLLAILSTLSSIIALVEKIVFGLFAVCALLGKEIKFSALDKIVDKHF